MKLMNPTDLSGSALFEHGNIALTVLNYHQGLGVNPHIKYARTFSTLEP